MPGTRPLTKEQQAAVAGVLRGFGPREKALIGFLSWTGFRISETLGVRVGDVWSAGGIRPRVQLARARMKGGRSPRRRAVTGRSVPINPVLAAVLTEALFARFGSAGPTNPDEPLFRSRQGAGALTRRQANRIVHRVLQAAGVEAGGVPGAYGCHSFRKGWCRSLYEKTGRDIALVRVAMGHKSVETTQQYLSVSDDEVDRAVLALGEVKEEQAAAFPEGYKEAPMV